MFLLSLSFIFSSFSPTNSLFPICESGYPSTLCDSLGDFTTYRIINLSFWILLSIFSISLYIRVRVKEKINSVYHSHRHHHGDSTSPSLPLSAPTASSSSSTRPPPYRTTHSSMCLLILAQSSIRVVIFSFSFSDSISTTLTPYTFSLLFVVSQFFIIFSYFLLIYKWTKLNRQMNFILQLDRMKFEQNHMGMEEKDNESQNDNIHTQHNEISHDKLLLKGEEKETQSPMSPQSTSSISFPSPSSSPPPLHPSLPNDNLSVDDDEDDSDEDLHDDDLHFDVVIDGGRSSRSGSIKVGNLVGRREDSKNHSYHKDNENDIDNGSSQNSHNRSANAAFYRSLLPYHHPHSSPPSSSSSRITSSSSFSFPIQKGKGKGRGNGEGLPLAHSFAHSQQYTSMDESNHHSHQGNANHHGNKHHDIHVSVKPPSSSSPLSKPLSPPNISRLRLHFIFFTLLSFTLLFISRLITLTQTSPQFSSTTNDQYDIAYNTTHIPDHYTTPPVNTLTISATIMEYLGLLLELLLPSLYFMQMAWKVRNNIERGRRELEEEGRGEAENKKESGKGKGRDNNQSEGLDEDNNDNMIVDEYYPPTDDPSSPSPSPSLLSSSSSPSSSSSSPLSPPPSTRRSTYFRVVTQLTLTTLFVIVGGWVIVISLFLSAVLGYSIAWSYVFRAEELLMAAALPIAMIPYNW